MAKDKGGAVVDEAPLVDLSPEALESKELVASAAADMVDRGQVQAVVEEWRRLNPFVKNVRGEPIPQPAMVVTKKFVKHLGLALVSVIQDCCEDTEVEIRRKIEAQRKLQIHGGEGVESLDTALAPIRGRLIVPVKPGG